MDTNPDADEPAPSTTAEPTPQAEPEPETEPDTETVAVAGEPQDELAQLAEGARKARLPGADEERLTTLLKENLLGGRAGVARVVELLPRLPWIVGVRAVETVWPELTAGFRTQLLSGLAKDESDHARRMRLSLARALFKIDPPVSLKVTLAAVKEMRDKETGALAPKDAQMFANVFIGRAKPWIVQLPLAELKPAEVEMLVHCTVVAAFTVPHPPVAQLGILKWVQETGKLGELDETALAAVAKSVARWGGKWQGALRREIEGLPEAIAAVLKPGSAEEPAAPGADRGDEQEGEDASPGGEESAEPRERRSRPVYVSREQEARIRSGEPGETDEDDLDEDEEEDGAEETEEGAREEPARGRRGGRGSREPRAAQEPRQGRGQFNLTQTLRQIEAHVNMLRADLESAKTKMRRGDQGARRRPDAPVIEGEPTPDELARLNQQLESRNAELQTRIEELTQHSEDVAAASGAADQPVADPDAQLRALLALKLQEDYEDFVALEQESNDFVVQQHYRTLIRHLFEVLVAQGVPFKAKA